MAPLMKPDGDRENEDVKRRSEGDGEGVSRQQERRRCTPEARTPIAHSQCLQLGNISCQLVLPWPHTDPIQIHHSVSFSLNGSDNLFDTRFDKMSHGGSVICSNLIRNDGAGRGGCSHISGKSHS